MRWTLAKQRALPAARESELLTESVGDETVVYDLNSKDVHRLSPLAALVFRHCDGQTMPADCADAAQDRLGAPVSVEEVLDAVSQLQQRSLLQLPPLVIHDGLSRRELVRKSTLVGAVALATPLISSIAAPSAKAAISGIPTGCSGCTKNPDCVSNHCCQAAGQGKTCNRRCCVLDNNSCHTTNCVGNVCECTSPLEGCVSVNCPPEAPKCCTEAPPSP